MDVFKIVSDLKKPAGNDITHFPAAGIAIAKTGEKQVGRGFPMSALREARPENFIQINRGINNTRMVIVHLFKVTIFQVNGRAWHIHIPFRNLKNFSADLQ